MPYIRPLAALLGLLTCALLPMVAWAFWGPGSVTLDDAYGTGMTGMIISITVATALAIASVVGIILTGGGATPIVASVGTFIGNLAGLSGVAATNYGLAMLGGGAIAAGGYGVVGGAAVLTALFTFTGNLAVDYAVTYGLDTYNEASFKEASKGAVILPLPERTNGDAAYNKVLERLKGTYKPAEPRSSVENRGVVTVSLKSLEIKGDRSIDEVRKLSLRALLSLYGDDYAGCHADAGDAAQRADALKIPEAETSFLLMIRALCLVGRPQTAKSDLPALSSLYHKAIDTEINGKYRNHTNIFVASYFDRYFGRDDLVSAAMLTEALSFLPVIEDNETKYTYFMLIAPRYNMKLNAYRSMINALYDNRHNEAVKGHPNSRKDMEYARSAYADLLSVAEEFNHYAGHIDPSRNHLWGTRWLHRKEAEEQGAALKSLAESFREHLEQQAEVEMQVAIFRKELGD